MLTRTTKNQKSHKLLAEMQNGIAISKKHKTQHNNLGVTYKIKQILLQCSNPTPKYLPKKYKNTCPAATSLRSIES